MKHNLRRPRKRVARTVLAAATLTLAVSGGTVGLQLADAGQSTAAAAAPRVAAAPSTSVPQTSTTRRTTPRASTSSAAPAPTSTATATASRAVPPAPTPTPTPVAGTSTAAPTTSAPAPAPTTAPRTSTPPPAPSSGAVVAAPSAAPLAGKTFYGPNTGAAQAATSGAFGSSDAALLSQLAGVPTATWLGSWSGDVTQTVRQVVTAAAASGAVPVLVAYNVPDTDCGGYSAGGASSPTAYGDWVQHVADGIGTAEVVVVVEPDALAQLCGDPATRYAMLDKAIDVLEANPRTHTYLDAGNPTWIGATDMAARLKAAGVADADGFSLNVSNFETTASNVTYGRSVSAALGGAHFVIDTSRNGNGPGTDWCNPAGRKVGERPTGSTGQAGVDAFLWVKRPGESDGTCNGGPSAGVFWPQYGIGLMRG